MGKGIVAVVLAFFLGFGVGKFTSPSLKPISVTTYSGQAEEKTTKSYVAMLDGNTYKNLIADGKAAPCFCHNPKSGDRKPCEHEELSCNKDAIKQCHIRFEGYVCRPGLAPTISRLHE